jgi:hypothetical protein
LNGSNRLHPQHVRAVDAVQPASQRELLGAAADQLLLAVTAVAGWWNLTADQERSSDHQYYYACGDYGPFHLPS